MKTIFDHNNKNQMTVAQTQNQCEVSLSRDSIFSIPFLQNLDEVMGHAGPALVQGFFKIVKAYWTNLFNGNIHDIKMWQLLKNGSNILCQRLHSLASQDPALQNEGLQKVQK